LSLDSAFKGASAIFGVNDFWVYFRNAEKRGEAEAKGDNWGTLSRDNDTQEIKNIIDAASRVPTLERFVLASMANSNKLSGGRYAECYHFEGKAIAEDYCRESQAELWKKTSVLYVGFYLENYLGPMSAFFLPRLVCFHPLFLTSLPHRLMINPQQRVVWCSIWEIFFRR
jgi:hypothetical protein